MIAHDMWRDEYADAPDEWRAQSPVQSGDVIAGKYRVERVVGAGGMGVVLAATHLQLGHVVAIKVLAPQGSPYQAAVPRFVQEARVAARIQNEHVVRVFDVGTIEDGLPYMAMEYLDGADLDRLLRRRGPLPVPEALECLLQACEGINEAHAVGVVHRDLKPGNLVRCEHPGAPPLVKVVDFGISKLRASACSEANLVTTAPHEIIGSPLYASPEQILSAADVDERTDIWALGAVCYVTLAGRPPFLAHTLSELCVRIAQSRPPSVHDYRADVPPTLAGIIDRCLAKEPRDRYQTVAELALALAPFAPPRAIASVDRIASRAAPAAAPSLTATLLSARSPRDASRSPRASNPTLDPAHAADGALRWALAGALLAVAVLAAALASFVASPAARARPPTHTVWASAPSGTSPCASTRPAPDP